ncbi:sulfotransferase [Phenylobacterium sp. LjRoot219]
MAGFLQDHPDVCFSRVKEPHFFSQLDLSGLAPDELGGVLSRQYLARYFPHHVDGRLLAEGSVSYLYAPQQMAPILRAWPNAKFVIAVRDPLEMLPSLHLRLLYTGDETVTDFERAWALMAERRQGRAVPPSCIDPRLLQYEEAGRLGAHVAAFFDAVGRERCFVVVFDDLAADPEGVYERLLSFLELPPHPREDFAPRRAGRGYKIAWLQRLLKRPPKVTRQVLAGDKFRERVRSLEGRRTDPAAIRAILAGRKALLRWNHAPAEVAALSPEMRACIRETLADEVAHLSELIGRDLGHWLDGAPAMAEVATPRRIPADGEAPYVWDGTI